MSAAQGVASNFDGSTQQRAWRGYLALNFQSRAGKTLLAQREQSGPLTLQKPFYPEGDEVCHCVVLHPPGGIVAGDELALSFTAQAASRALITTPGATKWYRSDDGAHATQRIEIDVAPGASVEWLPQETIFYNGARATSDIRWRLHGDALAFGWEVACLGRPAADERFASGALRLNVSIEHKGHALWVERARLHGDDPLMASPIGLRGHSVFATAYLAGRECGEQLLEGLRAVSAPQGAQVGLSALPGLLLARYLGDSAEQARGYFAALWECLRPAAVGRAACAPRIWST
jgi:urease accessory protein